MLGVISYCLLWVVKQFKLSSLQIPNENFIFTVHKIDQMDTEPASYWVLNIILLPCRMWPFGMKLFNVFYCQWTTRSPTNCKQKTMKHWEKINFKKGSFDTSTWNFGINLKKVFLAPTAIEPFKVIEAKLWMDIILYLVIFWQFCQRSLQSSRWMCKLFAEKLFQIQSKSTTSYEDYWVRWLDMYIVLG